MNKIAWWLAFGLVSTGLEFFSNGSFGTFSVVAFQQQQQQQYTRRAHPRLCPRGHGNPCSSFLSSFRLRATADEWRGSSMDNSANTEHEEPWSMDAISLSRAIRSGSITCEQLMESTLDRIDELNPRFNAIILLKDRESLLERARGMDRALSAAAAEEAEAEGTRRDSKADPVGWLYGIPIAIKDVSNAEGFPTTMGGSRLVCVCDNDNDNERTIPPAASISDPYVASMVRDGAVLIGKTNAPEGGLGSNTFNEIWGKTRNALLASSDNDNDNDNDLSAGGSSGGAAVAVATGMLALADGTDNMGSLRNPAGWNGIYSHRPTAGWIPSGANSSNSNSNSSNTPFFSPASTILPHPASTPGPMARNPLDCARLLQTMVGDTTRFDAASLLGEESGGDGDETGQTRGPTSTPIRIGWLGDWQGRLPLDEGILETCQRTLEDWSANSNTNKKNNDYNNNNNNNNNNSSNKNNKNKSNKQNRVGRFDIEVVDLAGASNTDPFPLFDGDELWEGYNTIRFASTYEKYSGEFDVDYLLSPEGRTKIKEELAWELEQGRAIARSQDKGKAELEKARAIHARYKAWLERILGCGDGDGDGLPEEAHTQCVQSEEQSQLEQQPQQRPPLDVLALPSAQVWPFPIDDRYPKNIDGATMDTYHRWMEVCVPVSFGGLPCVTLPTRTTTTIGGAWPAVAEHKDRRGTERNDGMPMQMQMQTQMPMGIQLFAKRGDDLRLLGLANDYHCCRFRAP